MADDVVIGSASVQIVGDYSGLEKSFKESQNIAQSAGQAIGQALESGSSGANTLTSALSGTTNALTGIVTPSANVTAQLQQLFAQGMSLTQAMAALQVQAAPVGVAIGAIAPQATQAATAIVQVGQAAAQAVPPLQQAAQASNTLLDSLLGFAATAITAAALERIGSESIQAFGRMQQLTTSLDLMGAGAHGAAVKVEELKNLSIQLAVPFENLAHQAQALSAQFGTGEGLTAILIAAGNSAAATGKSFDAASGAIERIGVTGAVSARQLFALGLSWQDMAEAMGVSIADAQAKLKKGGQDAQQDVANVIEAINAKFGDAADRQAQNTLGVWTNLKNQAEFIFQDIGKNLDGIVEIFAGGMKVIASGLISLIGGTQLVTVAVIGLVRGATDALVGLGHVAAATMQGNFAAAAVAASDAYSKIKTNSEYTDQSLQDHAKKTADQLLNIWTDSGKKISATFTPTGGGGEDPALKATRDKVRGFKDLTDSLSVWIAMEKDEVAVQQSVVNAAAKYNEQTKLALSGSQYLQLQVAKANGDFITFDALTSKAAGNLIVMAEAAKMAGLAVSVFDRSGEENKLAIAAYDAKTGFDVLAPSIDKSDKILKELGKDATAAQKQLLSVTPEGKMSDALSAIGIKWDKVTESTDRAKLASAEYVAANVGDFNKAAVAWEVLNSSVSHLSKVNLPEAIKVQDELIASMERMNAPMLQIVAAREKELQLEIQLKTEQGQSANAEIIALANMRSGTAALSVLNNSLANTYIALGNTIKGAIAPLSSAIAQIINGAGSFYKAWHQALNQFEAQLLGTVINSIIQYGVAWVQVHILKMGLDKTANAAEIAGIATVSAARTAASTVQLAQVAALTAAQSAAIATVTGEQMASFVAIRAASTALDIADVLGYAAVAGAAAFASTAAIPIVGPFLAPEAGALAYATVAATYAPLATFTEGGMVPEDMIAMVHKGEYVLNAEKTASAMVGNGPNGQRELHINFDFGGAHFSNGLNDTQVKTVFDRAFRMSKLAGALPAGRFPQ